VLSKKKKKLWGEFGGGVEEKIDEENDFFGVGVAAEKQVDQRRGGVCPIEKGKE